LRDRIIENVYDAKAEQVMRRSRKFNPLVLSLLDRARVGKAAPNRDLIADIIKRRASFAGIELPPLRWMNTPSDVFTFLFTFTLPTLMDMLWRDNLDGNTYCLIRRCSQTWMPLPR